MWEGQDVWQFRKRAPFLKLRSKDTSSPAPKGQKRSGRPQLGARHRSASPPQRQTQSVSHRIHPSRSFASRFDLFPQFLLRKQARLPTVFVLRPSPSQPAHVSTSVPRASLKLITQDDFALFRAVASPGAAPPSVSESAPCGPTSPLRATALAPGVRA